MTGKGNTRYSSGVPNERWKGAYFQWISMYEYDEAAGDPDNGIAPGTPFEDRPEGWVCPLCGLGKDVFEKE